MRRVQAVIVILMLAALPLVLLGQSGKTPACDGMCCVRHSMHGPMTATSKAMSCHHGAAEHLFECGMHSNQHDTQNALLAPLPPTLLSASTTLPTPIIMREARTVSLAQTFSGFLPLPFEPPRS
jgi:hypothetical protein